MDLNVEYEPTWTISYKLELPSVHGHCVSIAFGAPYLMKGLLRSHGDQI